MILTCPACATQYRLKDGAIPPEGRQVRCAACKHKWHQDGAAEAVAPDDEDASAEATGQWPVTAGQGDPHGGDAGISGGPPQPAREDAEAPDASIPESAAHDQMIAANPEPEVAGDGYGGYDPAADRAPGEAAAEAPAGHWGGQGDINPRDEDGFAAIPAMHDEEEPVRRSRMGWIVGLVLLVVAAAAAFYFLAPPELKARAGIAEAGGSSLKLMVTTRDRQKLASGNELLAISGRVINSTDREQAVPPIHAELRDPASNKLVYQWTIAAPARSLAPGETAPFNSAQLDVPQGGESLSLRFAS
jgi:predicted Zn finger-like uncharacterized protein